MNHPALEREVGQRLQHLLAQNANLEAHIHGILETTEAVVFGGWVRDAIHSVIHAKQLESRDLDLVVDGPLDQKATGTVNHFGGLRLAVPNGLSIDCWELSRTLAFARRLLAPSFANLCLSTVYRLNGCIIHLRTYRLEGEAAIEEIRNRRISFNCTGYLDTFPEYQAFRAIDLRDRLGYELDHEVKRFVATTLKNAGLQRFTSEVLEHRKHESASRLERLFRCYTGS